MNAGHLDFAVMEKESFEGVSVGRVEVHETVRKGKREYRIHEAVDKVGNIASHYDADVVVGKLSTGDFKSKSKRANRKVKNMPQHKFRRALKKLERGGIKALRNPKRIPRRLERNFPPSWAWMFTSARR